MTVNTTLLSHDTVLTDFGKPSVLDRFDPMQLATEFRTQAVCENYPEAFDALNRYFAASEDRFPIETTELQRGLKALVVEMGRMKRKVIDLKTRLSSIEHAAHVAQREE